MRGAALVPPALLILICVACGGGDAEPEPTAAPVPTRYLVYTRALGLPQQAIWIGDIEGRALRRLTRGRYARVSPDGTTIAVSRRAGIFTVDPDGGRERFIGRGRPAEWLPDSRRLLAVRGKTLVVIDVNDRSVDVIDRREGGTWSLSPDGKTVAYDVYTESGCGKFDIYAAGVDGSSKRRLTRDGRSSTPCGVATPSRLPTVPPGPGASSPASGSFGPMARGEGL